MPGKRALRIAALLVVLAVVSYAFGRSRAQRAEPAPAPAAEPAPPLVPTSTDAAILAAITQHRSEIWGVVAGTVERLLEDDRKGIPHQRFIIRIETGTTILVDYNLDLAPRITPLDVGDSVVVRGEYHWSEQGGRIHWVHRDPSGAPGGGWLRVRGKIYQ
ncbi:MAG TPA: DUF3465 domain-containing protein [Gemmatimonadales bacterium]|nr:DUF3465 domain-containing protein [Gemmatimonadales bacterium]